MVDIEELKPLIVERLKPLNPEKIILFGSYAYGTPTEESDIDLYVVTKDEYTPQSWRENIELTKKVSKRLRDLRKRISIDLIVHTKEMNRRFLELNGSFAREIVQKGVRFL